MKTAVGYMKTIDVGCDIHAHKGVGAEGPPHRTQNALGPTSRAPRTLPEETDTM